MGDPKTSEKISSDQGCPRAPGGKKHTSPLEKGVPTSGHMKTAAEKIIPNKYELTSQKRLQNAQGNGSP